MYNIRLSEKMKKTIIAALICILLTSTINALSIGNDNSQLKESLQKIPVMDIFVDDDFDSSTPGWDIDHFNKIQSGIESAENNDKIYVYEGKYLENLVINKTVTLIGENKENTIIDGRKYDTVINLLSSDVTIKQFTLQNSSNHIGRGALRIGRYEYDFSDILISDLIIKDNNLGIFIANTKDIDIKKCKITDNSDVGLRINGDCKNIIIDNCEITYNGIFGDIYCSGGSIFINNYYDQFPSDISIKNCVIHDNAAWGIYLVAKEDIEIANNEIYSSNWDGISFEVEKNLNIHDNNIYDNGHSGIFAFGFTFSCLDNFIFRDNYIANNNYSGIWVQDYNDYITIDHNTLEQNKMYGIFLRDAANIMIVNNNFLKSNISASFRSNNCENNWNNNYWDRPYFRPKIILGLKETTQNQLIPWINIDWNPALNPN